MRTDELDFRLPDELIATAPVSPRDHARLLVVSRSDPSRIEHRRVADLPELLLADDDLVVNRSRVTPAAFSGRVPETSGRFEGLFLSEADEGGVWSVMIKARRHREGRALEIERVDGSPSGVVLRIRSRDPQDPAAWLVDVETPAGWATDAGSVLERVGRTPIPPYIRKAREHAGVEADESADRSRYQTVYAEGERSSAPGGAGSVAAPTAGLHFTPDLLDRLGARGIRRLDVVLHVGAGTFRPIDAETLEEHRMHAEWCSLADAGEALGPRLGGAPGARRVIAVGTTTARTLESFAHQLAPRPAWLATEIFISPGHRWSAVDGLLTNFHLPRSSLLAMVGSLFGRDGVARLLEIYAEAIAQRYRFYSFGDAMLVLP